MRPPWTLYLLPTPDGSTCKRERRWDKAWTLEGLSSRKHITKLCWPPGWETCLFLLLKLHIHKEKHNNNNNHNNTRLCSAKSSFPAMEEQNAPSCLGPLLAWRWMSFESPLILNEQQNERGCIESGEAEPACLPSSILTEPSGEPFGSATGLLVKCDHWAITWQDFQLIKTGVWPPGIWIEW